MNGCCCLGGMWPAPHVAMSPSDIINDTSVMGAYPAGVKAHSSAIFRVQFPIQSIKHTRTVRTISRSFSFSRESGFCRSLHPPLVAPFVQCTDASDAFLLGKPPKGPLAGTHQPPTATLVLRPAPSMQAPNRNQPTCRVRTVASTSPPMTP